MNYAIRCSRIAMCSEKYSSLLSSRYNFCIARTRTLSRRYVLRYTEYCVSQRAYTVSAGNRIHQKYEHPTNDVDVPHGIIKELEGRLEQAGFKRTRRFYSIVVIFLVASVFGTGYLYFFPHKLREQVVEEVSTVASKSLEDEKIMVKAEQLSKDVINGILNDNHMKLLASDFVKDIILNQSTKDAAVATAISLLNDPTVLNLLQKRLSETILYILQSEDTRQIVISQVNMMLNNESVQQSLQHLLDDTLHAHEVQELMVNFFKEVLASEAVKHQGTLLGQHVTSDVITSKDIQQQAGDALWSALKFSFVPSILRGKMNNEVNKNYRKNNETEENKLEGIEVVKDDLPKDSNADDKPNEDKETSLSRNYHIRPYSLQEELDS